MTKRFLLSALLWTLAPCVALAATVSGSSRYPILDEFPPTPRINDIVVITDDSAAGACDSNAGSARTLCIYNGVSWGALGDGSALDTLDTIAARGRHDTGANSEANGHQIGTATNYYNIFHEEGSGLYIKPFPLSDSYLRCWTNKNIVIFDDEALSPMLTIDCDATNVLDKFTWTAGYGPTKNISLTADALYLQGAATLTTDSAAVSGGLTIPYITITDSNSDGFHRYFRMPDNWDGGTITATLTVINTNAAPANDLEVDISGQCFATGDAVATTISSTGEQPINIDFDSSGACGGSACSQNDRVSKTSAAITLNGTPAAGAWCGFQGQVDATATTTAQVADIRIVEMDLTYSIGKGF